MRESVLRFGPRNSLMGIVSHPKKEDSLDDSPIAILINAGIVHRVGPFRLHVDIARELAQQGFRSLRLDLSGLGDSPMRSKKMSTRERAIADIQDAMDALENDYGDRGFVLIGLCSGAFNAHKASLADDRVVGACFMDGIAFRTITFYLHRYGTRLMRPRFWRNAFLRRMRYAEGRNGGLSEGEALGESAFFDQEVIPDQAQAEVDTLLERGVRMLFLYTDGYDDISGPRQFEEMFGRKPDEQLQFEYFEKSEHTFRLLENRQIAVDRIASWYRSQFKEPLLSAT